MIRTISQRQLPQLFLQLSPTPWSAAAAMTPTQRARCFFVPNVEEIQVIALAQKWGSRYIRGHMNGAQARADFLNDVRKKLHLDPGDAGNPLGKNFDLAANFYCALISGVGQLRTALDPGVIEWLPYFEYDAGRCPLCRPLHGAVLHKISAATRRIYPPWHFDCTALALDTKGKAVNATVPDPGVAYFCNPFDVFDAFGLTTPDKIPCPVRVQQPRRGGGRARKYSAKDTGTGCLILIVAIGAVIYWLTH